MKRSSKCFTVKLLRVACIMTRKMISAYDACTVETFAAKQDGTRVSIVAQAWPPDADGARLAALVNRLHRAPRVDALLGHQRALGLLLLRRCALEARLGGVLRGSGGSCGALGGVSRPLRCGDRALGRALGGRCGALESVAGALISVDGALGSAGRNTLFVACGKLCPVLVLARKKRVGDDKLRESTWIRG